jgi:putative MFS transporter
MMPNMELDKSACPGGNTSTITTETDENKMTSMAWKVLAFVFFAWVIDAADGTIYSLTLPLIKEEFDLSLTQMGMVASGFLFGAVVGSFLLPIFAEKKGRRWGMVACVSLYSMFTSVIGIAQNITQIILGRFFTGLGTGAEWPIGAAYLSEMVPAQKRGWAMGIMQSGYPAGYFLAGGLFMC